MFELNANQALTKLYDDLKNLGEIKRELKELTYSLAEQSDWHRTDVCYYYCDGAIVNWDGRNCVITHGQANRTWRHLATVDRAVMYGKIDWDYFLEHRKDLRDDHPLKNIPEKETIDGLTDEQIRSITYHTIRKDRLIRSWEGELGIRDGTNWGKFTYIVKPIPKEFIKDIKISSSRLAHLRGVPILLDEELQPDKIRAKGLDPTGHQEILYKRDVVKFLIDHVKEVLSRKESED